MNTQIPPLFIGDDELEGESIICEGNQDEYKHCLEQESDERIFIKGYN